MRIIAIAGIILVLVSLGCAVGAADNPKVDLKAKDMPIGQAIAELAKQAGVQIVCDPAIKGTVFGTFESMELESVLGAITKTNNLTWQKVYLPGDAERPALEQVKARAAAVAAVTGGPIIVCDPATGKQKVFVEQEPATPSLAPDKLGLKPVYLVCAPKVETKAPQQAQAAQASEATAAQSVDAQLNTLLGSLTPDQRVRAFQAEMNYFMQLDPETRRQVMREAFRSMHDQAGGDRGNWRDRGDRGDRSRGSRRGDRAQ